MVSLGFLINLAGLLLSPPDGVSELTGYELVQTKVRGRQENLNLDPNTRWPQSW